ncbi:MAG: hypothetical protein JRG80_12855 [Deltaproteobacteria bacterium]|nr:hypothetical protein [Deltaproteobacteria bacterium]MBW2400145.1 hypothetical protein [Deltaproteobacteria bacterium]
MHARKWLGSPQHWLLGSVICAVIGFATTALAEPPPPEEGNWDFAITPYIWLPAMTGEVAVNGRSVEIDTSISDLFTESDFVFAVQVELAAWYTSSASG